MSGQLGKYEHIGRQKPDKSDTPEIARRVCFLAV